MEISDPEQLKKLFKNHLKELSEIIKENKRRNNIIYAPFNPVTGLGSVGKRTRVHITDFAIPEQYLPETMMHIPLVKKLIKAGSIREFLKNNLNEEPSTEDITKVSRALIRLRYKHDFPFWAATLVYIHNKKAGSDVLFRLYYPQRILVERFERRRLAKEPIRLILLKARQWGGSTTTQLYMAWLQLWHKKV